VKTCYAKKNRFWVGALVNLTAVNRKLKSGLCSPVGEVKA
jgi:hypothetical protein